MISRICHNFKVSTIVRKRKIATVVPPKRYHFFVDTNVLIYAAKKDYLALNKLVEDPNNFFYYTDTVKREFKGDINAIPQKIHFVPALLGTKIKEWGFNHLSLAFPTPTELDKFKSDLFIIFEAGYVCYDVIPFGDYPALLTNNMKLYRKFVSNEENHSRLREAVELYGMEHLIDVKTLAECGVTFDE